MTTDSPVAAAFVAAPDHWTRSGSAPRAIVIHHAEGGGTVSWLTRNDGNSSHYVVEYTGRVVQMVRESEAAGSMNPRSTRTGNDPAFTYLGESTRYGRSALDSAGISTDPNRYAIAIEVEGFAADGPNTKQRDALRRLVNDIRRRRGPLPCLGHRDQQDYKACPGKKIPWADYGGHAVKTTTTASGESGDAVKSFRVPEGNLLATIPTGRWLYDNSAKDPSTGNVQVSPGRDLPYVGRFSDTTLIVAYEPLAPDDNASSLAMFCDAEGVVFKRVPAPTTDPNPADLEAAHAKGYAEAKAKATAAVQGI